MALETGNAGVLLDRLLQQSGQLPQPSQLECDRGLLGGEAAPAHRARSGGRSPARPPRARRRPPARPPRSRGSLRRRPPATASSAGGTDRPARALAPPTIWRRRYRLPRCRHTTASDRRRTDRPDRPAARQRRRPRPCSALRSGRVSGASRVTNRMLSTAINASGSCSRRAIASASSLTDTRRSHSPEYMSSAASIASSRARAAPSPGPTTLRAASSVAIRSWSTTPVSLCIPRVLANAARTSPASSPIRWAIAAASSSVSRKRGSPACRSASPRLTSNPHS